ncbi:hypothetical protein K503DRAFT_830582, partial [Rhizopogon vinicolor AM-OR11-026]
DCDAGLLVGEPWKGRGGRIEALALSPDGRTIACGTEDGTIERWSTDGEMIGDVWTGHSQVLSLSWSPSGGHIASGSYDGTVLFEKQKTGILWWARSRRTRFRCIVLHIHLPRTKLHQADWTVRYASGTATPVCFLSAPSKT